MVITCYSGFSKKINSTRQPSGGTDKTVRLKDNCSVLNPVFLLNGYDLSHNYVKWGSRYYFINDIVIVGNEVAEYHCNIDVLATYKATIGNSSQYVLRSASAYNQFLNDSIYPTRSDCTSTTTQVGQLTCVEDSSVQINSGSCFVIGLQNGDAVNNGGINYYAMSKTSMANLLQFMFDTATFLNASDISVELQKELVNPFQYIQSIMWFPFDLVPSSLTTAVQLKFGYWDAPQTVYGYQINTRTISFSASVQLPTHPQAASKGAYMNSAPYTRHQLECFSFGSIPIDSSYFVSSHTMAVSLYVDLFTGAGRLKVANSNGDSIYRGSSMVGAPAQVSQITQNIVSAGMSVLGGAVGLAYGNVVGYAQGIVSGIANIMPQRQSTGSVGSSVDWDSQNRAMVTSTFYSQADSDNTDMGRPLCQRVTISSLSGFVLVERPDIESAGTEYEKNQIMTYMEGGFFYE